MTAAELRALIDSFPNDSKRHHHELIRRLAAELLQAKLENVLLKTMVPGEVREVVLLPCETDAA